MDRQFAAHQPTLLLSGGFVVGVVLARVIKAAASRAGASVFLDRGSRDARPLLSSQVVTTIDSSSGCDALSPPSPARHTGHPSVDMSSGKGSVHHRVADDSTRSLLSRLLNDAKALLRNETALAKSEFNEAIGNIKTAIGAMGTAAAVLVAGLLTLVAAAVLALAQVAEPWLAALSIGALLSVVGAVVLFAAKKTLASPAARLDQTQKALRADAAVVTRRASS